MNEPNQADLLRRLLERDPIAPAEFCEQFLPLLIADRRWSAAHTRDQDLIETAAEDAVLSFAKYPERYSAAKLGILPYLRMSARGDLLNAIRKEQRHAGRRAPLEAVEHQRAAGNDPQEPAEPPHGVSFELLRRRLHQELPDPRDREAVTMILDGVRKTDAYARLYGLTQLPAVEQKNEVKRIKDRLKRKLRRLGRRIDAEQR